MTIEHLLNDFYKSNGIPENGGVDKKTFTMKMLGLNLTLPNPKFRRNVIHIHDIQHILNDCDTSWKGEGYISGWEIATGMWKHFPLSFLSLFAMAYSLWLYPTAVFKGFKKGLNNIGIIDLEISKSDFLTMELSQLEVLVTKENKTSFGIWQWTQFLFWSIVSQFILLAPLIVFTVAYIVFK